MDIPQHIGIIMDGNRRWARAHRLPIVEGHRHGIRSVEAAVKWCVAHGVRVLTLFTFSTENWRRPKTEVNFLLKLFLSVLRGELGRLAEEKIRYNVIGRLTEVSKEIQAEIRQAIEATKNNTRLVLNVALNYGGRVEIVDAIRAIVSKKASPGQVNEELVSRNMYAPDIPDPDLIIRTSGEQRLSGFLLWESAYSELYFTPTLWPDFGEAELDAALAEYQNRERRFGK